MLSVYDHEGEGVEFRALSDREYQAFLDDQERVYLTQLIEYGDVRREEGRRVDRVGLVDDGRVVGAATVVYESWMRIFRRALVHFGPVLNFDDSDLVRLFIEELKQWVMRDPRVIVLRVNPDMIRRPYDDLIAGDESSAAKRLDATMAMVGATKVKGEYFDDTSIHPIFMYSKDLAGLDFRQAIASTGNNVRSGIRKAASGGVRVRFLGADDFPVLKSALDHTVERTGMPEISDDALERTRRLMKRMGPEKFQLVVSELDVEASLTAIEGELEALSAKIDGLERDQREAETRGLSFSKKHANQLREARTRNDALIRNKTKTEEVRRKYGDRPILTVSTFVETPSDMIFYHSGGYDDLASYRGIYAVHEAMIARSIERGKRWYNLHVIQGVFEEGKPGFGLLDYKRNFHGTIEELVGTYEFALRPFLARNTGAVQS
ncbi:peptidoglycan bridge formation glycyltransferase FemA/FemB family protein [Actinomycetaceae bacterium MB13-C1-2]|nr:peptidoglycan bridge formation glycyltransferase FemA/FemB family protein [Actinomycetaceae bacterium MB13-C1-2]